MSNNKNKILIIGGYGSVEHRNTIFVQQCIQKGIDYVDISASYQFLSASEAEQEF